MSKEITGSGSASRPEWEQLEVWVRGQVQRLIQELLEEEVTESLGRAKSARRSESDSDAGYRNGYAKPRRLTLSSGTIQLRRPRVRDTEERFESRLLPLFVHRTRKVSELIPELYLHGLSEGDFDLAVRGLLGEEAPVSASTVARLKDKWNAGLAEWHARSLDDLEVVCMWVDGVYVKAGLEKEKAAILVVMAALSDGRKVVVTLRSRLQGVDRELVRGAQRHEAPRAGVPKAGDWRRTSGYLGSSAQRLSPGGGATLLEPQDDECAGQATQATAGRGQAHAARHPLRRDPGRC